MKAIKNTVILTLLFVLYYIIPLNYRNLWQPDETRYAEISREMLAGGSWIAPHFLGLRYFEKPVAGYWVNNVGQWLWGDSNFAVRFGSMFSVSLTALLIYWMSWTLWRDKRTSVMAALIFLSSLLVYGVGSYAVLDPMITLWLAVAMYCLWLAAESVGFWHKTSAYLLFGLACGLGFMTKGFLALLVPMLSALPWAIQQKRCKELLRFGLGAALPAALVISLPWVFMVARREPDFWHYFFWIEHIQRFAQHNAQHRAPFWYYAPVLIFGALPWLALLPGAIARAWRQRRASGGAFYLLGWVLMPLLFFSMAEGKLLTYILPCFVPLSMLMARHASRLRRQDRRILTINGWINIAFGLSGALVALLYLLPWRLASDPLYAQDETGKAALALLGFVCWAVIGALSLRAPAARWHWVAACPLGIALVIGVALPNRMVNAMQPQPFIQAVRPDIGASRFILTNDVGLAAALAWELKRSDIILFDQKGELAYGLGYPDAAGRFVSATGFRQWLAVNRPLGTVSVVLRISADKDIALMQGLPVAAVHVHQGAYRLVQYRRQP